MDVRGVSRQFGAFALVAGPLLVAVGSLFQPYGDNDSVATSVNKVAAHLSEQRALLVTDLVATLMLPAMLYLMRLARGGAPRLAVAGGAIAFAGWLGGLISLGGSDVLVYQAARQPDRASAVALVKAVFNDPGFVAPLAVFLIGHIVGMLLLGIALWRSKAVATWAAALIGLGPIVQFVVDSGPRVLGAAAWALVLIGTAACAVQLLRISDDRWDLPARATGESSPRPATAAVAHS